MKFPPIRIFTILVIGFAQAGCATTPKSCQGLMPKRLSAETHGSQVYVREIENPGEDPVARLQCEADRGDRVAIVKLGMRYETGEGLPLDARRAVRLYRQAAADVPPNTAIYSPPVKKGGTGQVMLIPNGNAGPGLAIAKYRLGRLYVEGRGVERNEEKGLELIEAAAALGDAEAKAFLESRN